MTKKVLNQNGKCVQELIDSIEPNFIFNGKPIDRFGAIISQNNINVKILLINNNGYLAIRNTQK